MQVEMDLPMFIEVKDYHDFESIEYILNKFIKDTLICEEVGYSPKNRRYHGVLYIEGHKPEKLPDEDSFVGYEGH